MNNTDFLNIFEEKIRDRIVEFCTKINKSNADLYILMARKAACFINALEEFSLIAISGEVISERVLDTKINWSTVKNIVIIDDVIISGTTLNRTIKKIKNINNSIDIKVFVLGINEKWFNPKLLEDEQGNSYIDLPIKPLENSQCIKLSGDIVKMLSMIPTPYNIDYPIYNTIKLNEDNYDRVLNMPGWEINDASSYYQINNNIFTYTFIPNKNQLSYCGNLFLSNLIKDSLIKIRIYGRSKKKKKKEMLSFAIVPMAILPPLNKKQIDLLFAHLSIDKFEKLSDILLSETSKLRFIQFVIADRLANIFIQEIDYYTGKNISIVRKYNSLRFLFPNSVINDIIEIADKQITNIDINYNGQDIPPKQTEHSYLTDNFIGINNTLNTPFLHMYYQYEIPARYLAQKYGAEVFDKEEYNAYIDRLNKGYSLLDLTHLVSDYSEEVRIRIVSAFLDRAIDNGIAVPITVTEGNTIYRAFRHGEDVQFGQREERLCFEMFNAFHEQVNKDELQKIWIEKLMVFFLKLGEPRFLDPIQTEIANYKHISGDKKISVASVKYYLQGPVVTRMPVEKFSKNPCLEYSDKVNWLSKDFLSNPNSPLQESKSGMFRFDQHLFSKNNDGDSEIVTDKSLIKDSVEIGYIFGLLINNGINKRLPSLNNKELVALSCCCEPKEAIGAMAAEINLSRKIYINTDFSDNVKTILLKLNNNEIPLHEGIQKFRRSPMYQAINDGQRKFDWYIKKYPYEIINRIKSEFKDVVHRNIWDSFWSPNLDWTEESETAEKIELAKIEGLWLICINMYFLIIEYVLYSSNDDRDACDELFEKIETRFCNIEFFASHSKAREIIPFVREFKLKRTNRDYIEKLFSRTMSKIDNLFNYAESIVENAEDFYNFHLKTPDINYYNCAIYIETELDSSNKIVDNIFKSICFRITKSAIENNATLKDLPKYANIISEQKGDWYIGSGGDAAFWLSQFAGEIVNSLNGRDNYKIFYCPDLPSDCVIKIIDKYKFTYNKFWEFIAHFANDIEYSHFQNNVIYEIRDARIQKTITIDNNNKFGNYCIRDVKEIELRLINSKRFNIYKHVNTMSEVNESGANIGILTIVTEESQAVLTEFGFGKNPIKKNGRLYDEVNYKLENGKDIKIVHLQSSNQGNIPIVSAYHDMVKNYNLDYVILLGIAGSIRDKIKLCDVMIGTNVIYYEKRKESGLEKPERRGEIYNISFDLTQILNRFFVYYSEPAPVAACNGSINESFNIHKGVIGSGEAVVADALSNIKKWLIEVNSKTGVVETEAAGFCQAFYETQNKEEPSTLDIILIRGISDHADHEKDDKWRLPASKNAVVVLKKLLELLYM